MLEIPEAAVIAKQINETLAGKTVRTASAASSPHKFAWFFEDPAEYGGRLAGKTIETAKAYGGRVEMGLQGVILHFGDGVNLRYYSNDEKRPLKHQLLVEFTDGTALVATVAMYGGIWCFNDGEFDNFYYKAAKEKPSPLSDEFDYGYYLSLFDENSQKMSAKAFLATEQRIPGLGNGVLQDILLNAKIHPKRKIADLSDSEKKIIFESVKYTLSEMEDKGGRSIERDLFGNSGGYIVKLSKNTPLSLCPNCGGNLIKENYLGGSIYYCEICQIL